MAAIKLIELPSPRIPLPWTAEEFAGLSEVEQVCQIGETCVRYIEWLQSHFMGNMQERLLELCLSTARSGTPAQVREILEKGLGRLADRWIQQRSNFADVEYALAMAMLVNTLNTKHVKDEDRDQTDPLDHLLRKAIGTSFNLAVRHFFKSPEPKQ